MDWLWPKISIIIPALNEEKHIKQCIDSILKTDYPAHKKEIIVVDNGSKDDTALLAEQAGATVLVKKNVNVGALRNFGVAVSHGDVLAFLDADCTVGYHWAKEGVKSLEKNNIGVAGCVPLPPATGNWLERVWGSYLVAKKNQAKKVNYINSGNCFIRKDVFEMVNGFSSILKSSEDTDICNRINALGYQTVYNDKIEATHWGYPRTFVDFMRREIWHGLGSSQKNIKKFWKSKPICMAMLNVVLVIIVVLSFFVGNYTILLVSIGGFVLPNLAYTVFVVIRQKSIKSFWGLFILISLYGISRSISLLILVVKGKDVFYK